MKTLTVNSEEINAELLQALKDLAKEVKLNRLNIRKDFSFINAHACALKAIYKAESKQAD